MNTTIIPRSCQVEKRRFLENILENRRKDRILRDVLKIKRQQYIEKYGYEPNELELDNFEDWETRLEVRPWCDRKNHVLFRDVLTKEVRPFNCNQLRCGCPECTRGYVRARRKKMQKVIERYALNRFWTITLNQKAMPGKTQDEMRVNAWSMSVLSEPFARLKRAVIYFLVKSGWAKKEDVVFAHWFEPHQNLMPHIHVLTNQYFPREKLIKLCERYGFGYCFQKDIGSKTSSKVLSEYSSKMIIDPNTTQAKKLAEYAAKEVKEGKQNVDEKFFDKRALHYIPKRMRLIGFTRNVKIKKEDSGVSPWALMINTRELALEKMIDRVSEVPEYSPLNELRYSEQLQMIVDILEDKLKIKLSEKFKKDLFVLKSRGTLEEVKVLLKQELQRYCFHVQPVQKEQERKTETEVQRIIEEHRNNLRLAEVAYRNLEYNF